MDTGLCAYTWCKLCTKRANNKKDIVHILGVVYNCHTKTNPASVSTIYN